MQAVVLRAGATTPLRIVLDDAVASLPAGVMRRRRDEVPQSLPRRGEIPLYEHIGAGARNQGARRLGFPRPRFFQVAHPALRFANMLDRLGMLEVTLRRGIDPHRLHAGVGKERISMRAKRLADVVLEEAVNQDHVPAGKLLAARHLLPDELAVMNHELDVEALHPAAGLALARAGLLDAAEPLAEREISLLDRILQERPVDLVGERVDEGRVAFKLREAERRTQRPDQRVHDVGDDVLGMIEFDAGHEVRVAGYVGDRETG